MPATSSDQDHQQAVETLDANLSSFTNQFSQAVEKTVSQAAKQ
jgi:glycerate kinase